jgi:protein SCO1/2
LAEPITRSRPAFRPWGWSRPSIARFAVACAMLGVIQPLSAADYPVTGMVVSVDRAHRRFTASIQEIPNYMAAMTMPFEVREAQDLDGLAPGVVVSFTLHVDSKTSWAGGLRVVRYESTEKDPFSANRLTLLRELASGTQAVQQLPVGASVPDFTLVDQQSRPFALSSVRGAIVAMNFVYTTCALPNYCLRLANNFAALQKRFAPELGRDLVLVTVSFDPTHDTPEVLAAYAKQWNANTAGWHFLTGPAAEVDRVCRLFGVHAFVNEGLLDHSLHTVLVGRDGTLVANIEGNQFTATQLEDLTSSLLRTPRPR